MVIGVAGGNTVRVGMKIKFVNMQVANINVVTLNVGYKWRSSCSLL